MLGMPTLTQAPLGVLPLALGNVQQTYQVGVIQSLVICINRYKQKGHPSNPSSFEILIAIIGPKLIV